MTEPLYEADVKVTAVRDALKIASAGVDEDDGRIAIDDIADDAITEVVVMADARVSTYLSGKQVDPNLADGLTTGIACYLLILAWRGSDDVDENDPVVRRYRDAMQVLEDIGTGRIAPVTTDPTIAAAAAALVNQPAQPLTGLNGFGFPVVLDQPWGYPGAW